VALVDILMVMSAQVMAFRYTNVQTADTQTFDILTLDTIVVGDFNYPSIDWDRWICDK